MNILNRYLDKRHFLYIFSGVLFVFFILLIFFGKSDDQWTNYKKVSVYINENKIHTYVADNSELTKMGLSGKTGLKEDEAMLFIFPTPQKYGFWMKDMLFPIDIAWFDQYGRLITVKSVLTPETYPQVYYPEKDSLYVLETRAGFFDSKKIKIGDEMKIGPNN